MRLPTIVVRGDVLASWFTVSGYTRSRLAGELEVSKGRISQLLSSHEEPSAHLMSKLILVTQLPFDRLFRIVHQPQAHGTPPSPWSLRAAPVMRPQPSRRPPVVSPGGAKAPRHVHAAQELPRD